MTAQMPDSVVWSGRTWQLVGHDGTGLFSPAEHGIPPVPLSTANWRGYLCHYDADGGRLTLARLEVGVPPEILTRAEAGDPPQIGGVGPTFTPGRALFTYVPSDLQVPYTGRLLLGDRFIRNLYVHMGFHPAWKYEQVVELQVREGVIESAEDRSKTYAEIRRRETGLKSGVGSALGGVTAWLRRLLGRSDGGGG